jgi:hypothetical protein
MNLSKDWMMIAAIFILTAASFALYQLRYKIQVKKEKEEPKKPSSLPDGGLRLPVLEVFSGLKGLGSFALMQNKKDPEIYLYEQHLTYKMRKAGSVTYDQIKSVRATVHPFYFKAHLIFHDRNQTLIVYFPNEETLRALTNLLARKSVPLTIKES